MAQWLHSSQILSTFIRPSSLLSYTSKSDCILNYYSVSNWKAKGWSTMAALSKFLLLLAIFLLANSRDAFMNLSSAGENRNSFYPPVYSFDCTNVKSILHKHISCKVGIMSMYVYFFCSPFRIVFEGNFQFYMKMKHVESILHENIASSR